jgi:SH3 domain protein
VVGMPEPPPEAGEKGLTLVELEKQFGNTRHPSASNRTQGGRMKTPWIMLLVITGLFGITRQGHAAKAYVTDSFEVTLRSGPSNENKIVAMLFSGRPLEIVETRGDWSQVKVSDDNKEGWVLSRYLISRLPWEVQARRLQEDLSALNAKLSLVQKEFADESQQRQGLAAEFKRKSEDLEVLSKQYLELKKGAEGYLKLKTLYAAAQNNLKAAQDELDKLSAENERLKSSEQNRWFMSGALVLLCGLLIGGIVGRQQKKRRSLYS